MPLALVTAMRGRRGVARVYRMTLDDNVWTLLRDEADFSPLGLPAALHR
jgi:hypothetical protein